MPPPTSATPAPIAAVDSQSSFLTACTHHCTHFTRRFLRQGLTLGVNAIELAHKDAWRYKGLKSGNKVALAAAISSTRNWEYYATYLDSSSFSPPTGFAVLPMPPPLPPSPPPLPPAPPQPPNDPPLPPLVPGDCMVVAVFSDDPDTFSIVLLSTLGRGQSIAVTDMGWLPEAEAFYSSGYNPETASVVHTASDDEPPGRVLTQANFSGGPLDLSTYGDQLLVYQGTEANPVFLCAFDWSGYAWQTSDWSYSGTYKSGLPRGLTSGVDALNPVSQGWISGYSTEHDNWAYTGTDSEHISGLRTAIATSSNWQYSDSRSSVASLVKTAFTVLPPPPSPPPSPPPLPPAPPQPPNDPPLPPLMPGDCMVVAALSSTPDAFSIVLLSTLGRGQSIAATDMGWLPEAEEFNQYSPSYYSSRGPETTSVVHTASDDELPGTVLTQADFSGGPLSLGTQDQLLIYQGTHDNPTFLCAFDWSTHDWKSTDCGWTPSCPPTPTAACHVG